MATKRHDIKHKIFTSLFSGCFFGGNYDFIIVGAGSSGTLLANRLSNVKRWKVLVLEAGGEDNEISDIPAMYEYLKTSDFNWGYQTVPQNNSLLGKISIYFVKM